jgi:hypothetical protein
MQAAHEKVESAQGRETRFFLHGLLSYSVFCRLCKMLFIVPEERKYCRVNGLEGSLIILGWNQNTRSTYSRQSTIFPENQTGPPSHMTQCVV